MFAEQGNHVPIRTPYDILDGRCSELCKDLLLLNIEKDHRGWRGEEDGSSTAVEDVVGLRWTLDGLGQVVGEISNLDVLAE